MHNDVGYQIYATIYQAKSGIMLLNLQNMLDVLLEIYLDIAAFQEYRFLRADITSNKSFDLAVYKQLGCSRLSRTNQ